MATEALVEIGFLNIVATPHPPGVYPQLLAQVATRPVYFWGDLSAAITKPRLMRNEKNVYYGRLLIWAEIDPDAPAIDKQGLIEKSLADLDFEVPRNVGFNGRAFYYMLDEKSHVIAVELRNEFGKTVSINRAARIFERLLSPEMLGEEAPSVEVTVIPQGDALSHVLGLKRLDRIEILVKRPNADDITPKVNAIMQELDEQHVKKQEIVLWRESQTDGIDLNDKNQTYAEVATTNGYVKSTGKDEEGVLVKRSTKEYPKIAKIMLDTGATILATLRETLKGVRPNRE